MKLALIFICSVAICLASHSDGSAPEEEFMEMGMESQMAMMKSSPFEFASGNPQVLQNLVDLKAYCSAAYDQTDELKSSNEALAKSALVDLILLFGKPVAKKTDDDDTKVKLIKDKHPFHPEKDMMERNAKIAKRAAAYRKRHNQEPYNLVTDYAKIVGHLQSRYFTGFGRYLVRHLNKAMLHGKGVVEVRRIASNGRNQAGFIGKILGFQNHPHYLDQLSVLSSDYWSARLAAIAMAKNADSEAATEWLVAGGKKQYTSFYGKIKRKVDAKSEKLWKKVIKGALKGVRHAWKKHNKLRPEVPGGVLAAQEEFKREAKKLKLPTNAQMVAAAKKLAQKWQKAHKKQASRVSKLIEKEEHTVERKAKAKAQKKEKAVKKKAAYKRAAKLMAQAGGKYVGTGWCETFHECVKGDKRKKFWAWSRKTGYKMFKGACANAKGVYGKRHKFWKGKFSWAQCMAKCERTDGCEGITMPTSIKPAKKREEIPSLRKPAPHLPCTGKTWCETFTTCARGDKRNFFAWVKAEGYQRYNGACATVKGKYAKRHKYWKGKFTYAQCRAKCDKMGKKCQGITMPTWIQNCQGPKMPPRRVPKYVCTGEDWCETYQTCPRGNHRPGKWAWVKNKGYGMYQGSCANGTGRIRKTGKWTFERCRAKCDYLGKNCAGITMPATVKCRMELPKAPAKKKKPVKKKPPQMVCKGKDWCETFHTCVKGDGRKFNAWVKNPSSGEFLQLGKKSKKKASKKKSKKSKKKSKKSKKTEDKASFTHFKGACANSKGKYGKRHKFWKGKHTFEQCKARCVKMGKACQGITMPLTVKCALKKKTKKKKKKRVHAKLTCTTTTLSSNNAGIVKTPPKKGFTIMGGGMVNHYRHWNAKAGFEEALPEGNSFRCDTGFGPGRLTCYARSCKTNVEPLDCITRRTTFKGVGYTEAHLPDGYVMTGGGLNNHYRSWDKRAGFEETRPIGNAWRGDMGFGWGKFSVYVRGCKAPVGRVLSCLTLKSSKGNYNKVTCPAGFQVTSCGVNNHYRSWNSKSGYESHFPVGSNQCHCDTAFGSGSNTCYARCCKLLDAN